MTLMHNVKKDLHTHSRQEPLIKDSGLAASVTVSESKSGQMAPAMKVAGKITELTAWASSFILMAIFTKETG